MKSKLLWFSVGLFILGSCASTNTVSNSLITKRKHNKGFHINFKKGTRNLAVNEKSEKDVKEQPEIKSPQHNEETTVLSFKDSQELNTESNEKAVDRLKGGNKISLSIRKKVVLGKEAKSDLPTEIVKVPESAMQKERITRAFDIMPSFEATNKIRENEKRQSNNANYDRILLVVLCFFVPPLAVYLYEGSWTQQCTVNLILTLLCGLPGIIHALIVVLE
ncbi:MAG: YqaE/Pmp3 family membrane protein [Bacteroidota bacterium]